MLLQGLKILLMPTVLLAFDSFKGSVRAEKLTDALVCHLHRSFPTFRILPFPVADGGEGTTDMLAYSLPVKRMLCQVHDPLMEPIAASYIVTSEGIAVIEMAAASGLPLVEPSRRNPMETTTLGTGELIRDALKRGYRKFILGLGGSATNDAGMGMLHALGVRFYDKQGVELFPIGKNLIQVARIDTSKLCPELKCAQFVLACDVTNPFYGEQGAAVVYAPQKGATTEQVAQLDAGLQSYAAVLLREMGYDLTQVTGAGAAGGMGGGLLPFLKAEMKSGIDILLDTVKFDEALDGTDLILTGEGKLDRQTIMGKAVSGVLKRALAHHIPVIGLGGCVEDEELLAQQGFTAIASIHSSGISVEDAMKEEVTLQHLCDTAERMVRNYFIYRKKI